MGKVKKARGRDMAIGYACVTVGVQNSGLSRCMLKNATAENIKKITGSNLQALENMLDYNIRNGIRLFRISSDIVSFGSHPVNTVNWQEEFREDFLRLGKKISSSGMRVSMHPGQYTVLNSPDPDVAINAVQELSYHGSFLDALGMNPVHKIVLHIGGVYGDKEKSTKAFIRNYLSLSGKLKERLIIENDGKNYTVRDVLEISKETALPVVFDNLHHRLNPSMERYTDAELVEMCGRTWKKTDERQKIHYSQQKEGAAPGAHSDTIFLDSFLDFYNGLYNKGIDIMLEVKDKNLSAVKCINTAILNFPVRHLEEEWARYKYFVLSRSARLYNEIRQLLKEKDAPSARGFYGIIEKALVLPVDTGAEVNAAEHVWGYVNKDCSEAEKKRYENLLQEVKNSTASARAIKNHLLKLAEKQGIDYLKNSLYFYI